uniref:Calponin-homology (CH) domain-containing protein n=1 Tax=Periophthalmus magnuspinnatus TaxID=409849 RepID=A0A3B4B2E6_9GOBI
VHQCLYCDWTSCVCSGFIGRQRGKNWIHWWIENIDACLSFLAAKGVNIQGLSSEEIGNGNLKAILGLFFSLSRFKQQHTAARPRNCHLCTRRTCRLRMGRPPLDKSTQSEFVGSDPVSGSDSVLRLPGPTGSRVPTAESSGRIGSNCNRRSQVFDSKGLTCHPSAMTEHSPVSTSVQSATSYSALVPPPSSSSNNNTAIPQPNASSKPWRNKSTNKNSTSTSCSTKTHETSAKTSDAPPKVASQKSMLEKLKLFNSKSASKSSTENATSVKLTESSSNTDSLEVDNGNVRPATNGANPATASSPKIALKGIAQRTFSRALTAKKSSVKAPEKDKSKVKDSSKRVPTPEIKVDESKDEMLDSDCNKRTSKIASFIPKGGKVTKKEVQSGIPKPGAKNQIVKSSKEVLERPKSARLGGHLVSKGAADRDSGSSLGSTEGQRAGNSAPCVAAAGTTQSTASNTVSVQLPQNQQLHCHPNMATVAPFMYR